MVGPRRRRAGAGRPASAEPMMRIVRPNASVRSVTMARPRSRVASGGEVERAVAEVGVGVRVEADARSSRRRSPSRRRRCTAKRGLAAVVVAEPGGEARVDEQRVAGVALEARAAARPARPRRRRSPMPDVEEEVAAVDRAEADPVGCCPAASASSRLAGGLDRVVREADRAGEHVGRAAGQRGRGRSRCRPGRWPPR